jgi:hypothetical protein
MDNCGNSRANTCTKDSTLREESHLLDQDQWDPSGFLCMVTLDNCANRMAYVPAMSLSSVCLINFRW